MVQDADCRAVGRNNVMTTKHTRLMMDFISVLVERFLISRCCASCSQHGLDGKAFSRPRSVLGLLRQRLIHLRVHSIDVVRCYVTVLSHCLFSTHIILMQRFLCTGSLFIGVNCWLFCREASRIFPMFFVCFWLAGWFSRLPGLTFFFLFCLSCDNVY